MVNNFNMLQESFSLFPRLTEIMFGWKYDMAEIENKVRTVIIKDCFDRTDLIIIRDAQEWNFRKYWPDVSMAIDFDKPIKGIFKLGWAGNRKTISELYERVLHIEVASAILRFVDPINYAIISPPVERIFSLQPKEDHVEYYINYLKILKKIANHFQYPNRLADVDMSVWCLSHLLKNWGDKEFREKWIENEKSTIELIIYCYKKDNYFKKIRLNGVLNQVYQDIEEGECEPNRIFLAECLDAEEIDPELAMITIAFCFERFLWKLVEEAGRVDEIRLIRPRQKWVEALLGSKIFETAPIFYRCIELRDRAVHPWLKKLDPKEREEFIDNIEKLILKKKANSL